MKLERVEPRGWTDCIVAATGPSLTLEVMEQCARARRSGHRIIAVNDAYRRVPFAEVLYAGDRDWWELHAGCPDFAGEKWTAHDTDTNDKSGIAERYGLQLVAGPRRGDAVGFSFDPSRIHYGGNSGFQAINLAILFGATRILLVGFDMRTPPIGRPRHFFGDHPERAMNLSTFEHFLPAFHAAARRLPPHIRIVNCTPGSALRCFPMLALDEALAAVAA